MHKIVLKFAEKIKQICDLKHCLWLFIFIDIRNENTVGTIQNFDCAAGKDKMMLEAASQLPTLEPSF